MSTLLSTLHRFLFAVMACEGLLPPVTVQAAPEITVWAPHELQNNAPIGMMASSQPFVAGSNAATQTVTIRNTGTDPLAGVAAVVTGPGFTLTSLPAATVEAGGSTSFVVKFAPPSIGTFTGTLTMTSNDADENPFRLTLKGASRTVGQFSSPLTVYDAATGDCLQYLAKLEFGPTPVGTAVDRTFTIVNPFSWTRTLYLDYDYSSRWSQFLILSRPAPSLAGFASTQFTVRCLPTAAGGVTDDMTLLERIISGGPGFPPTPTFVTVLKITLQGTGTGPEIAVEQQGGNYLGNEYQVPFGQWQIGATTTKIITITNTGNEDLTGLAVTIEGAQAGDFGITAQPALTTLAPGGSTRVTAMFSPRGLGTRQAVLRIASNDYNENPFLLTLTGSGPVPAITVEDGTGAVLADNAVVPQGTSSTGSVTSQTFTIRNTGHVPLTGLTLALTGAQAGNFRVVSAPAAALPADASAVFAVEFSPLTAGSYAASLQISSMELADVFDLRFSAVVTGPEIVVETAEGVALQDGSAAVEFGGALAVTASGRMFTLRNTGNEPLAKLAFSVTGMHADDFAVVPAGAASLVAAGGSTTFVVEFLPGAIGRRSAALSIASNDADESPFVIALSGTWAGGPAQDFSLGQGAGTDGPLTVATVSEGSTVRAALTDTAVAGALVLPVSSSTGFSAGGMIVVLQMTGIKAGHFEEALIAGLTENSLTLQSPLRNTFPVSPLDAAQVISVAQYSGVTILPGGTLTCAPWDGSTGGVLWLKVAGTFQNDGAVDVTAKGFAGGASTSGGAGGAGGAGGNASHRDGGEVPGGAASGGSYPGGAGGGSGFAGGPGAGFPGRNAGASGPAMLAGAGGAGGHGGRGGAGAGGGGRGGSSGSITGVTDGGAGGPGGQGGTGGAGGQGGGITFIEAHRLAGGGLFRANGTPGENGTDGSAGAAGGPGGAGSIAHTAPDVFNGPPNVIHIPAGSSGGGGRGGEGGQAGAGGEGGGGGFMLIRVTASSFTGTGSGEGGIPGSAGAAGTGGPGTPGPGGPAGLPAAPASPGTGGTFQISVPPGSYTAWLAGHFSAAELNNAALSGSLADADSDGVVNLLEFAFNLDPRTQDPGTLTPGTGTGGLPLITLSHAPDGPRLGIEFLRRKAGSQPGISYQAVFSGDLGSAGDPAANEVVTSVDETWERVVASDPGPAGAVRRFGRVKVSVH